MNFYELHVTVENADKGKFKQTCSELGVKPIILDLQDKDGVGILEDVMTSSIFKGDDEGCQDELSRISSGLTRAGFKVVREKIETSPSHPSVPTTANGLEVPEGCYFESHLNVVCNDMSKGVLQQLAHKFNYHLSRNIFKALDNGFYKIMLTYRDYYNKYEQFKEHLDHSVSEIKGSGFDIDKVIVEYAIHDTKVSHDNRWIGY